MNPSTFRRFADSFTILQRLAAAVAVLILLLVLTAAVGIRQLTVLNETTTSLAEADAPRARLIGDWFAETKSNLVRATALVQATDAEFIRKMTPQLQAGSRRISVLQNKVQALLRTEADKALFTDVAGKRKAYLDARARVVDLKKAGRDEEATKLVESEMTPAITQYEAAISVMLDRAESNFKSTAADAARRADAGLFILVLVCASGVVLGALVSWLVASSITRPLREAVVHAQRVAHGDLTQELQARGRDETCQLIRALSEMTLNLRTLVGQVAGGAHVVAETSGQIAQGNLDLSRRTEEQASTLEETASSMEEMAATVSQNAESTRRAAHLAIGASEVAREGGESVRKVVTTMSDISESSRKIAEIVGVIEGIAFQTNILALNAAVEAARAGEQGRGFAVVASEVRILAKRSAEAAKEIKSLIGESVAKVGAGAALADTAGKTMQKVVDSVEEVTDLIGQIATASQEQSAGIKQVSTAVNHMDQVVQQNAALVEEATATTESMREQAAALLETVSQFCLGGEPEGAHQHHTLRAVSRHGKRELHAVSSRPTEVDPRFRLKAA